MEIVDVHAVELPDLSGGGYGGDPESEDGDAWRESWEVGHRAANPMTRYPEYAATRSLWRPAVRQFGVVAEAADGTTGFAWSSYGPFAAPIVDEFLGERVEGEDAMAVEKIHDMMVRMCSPIGPSGTATFAVSAIDLALWDLKGKLLERPVYELLGGPARDEIPCYATGNDTDWHVELGFEASKLACPYGPADGKEGLLGNERLVAEARDTLDEDMDLMLDCWMGFDEEYTVRLAERLSEYDLKWFEDYLWPDDYDAFASVRSRLPDQGLATGEHWYTVTPFQHAARHDLVDVFQPDIVWCGGLTTLRKVVDVAAAAGKTVIPHGGANFAYSQHACLAFPEIPWGEYYIGSAPGVPLEEASPWPGVPTPEDGSVVPSDDPGFGVDVDPATLDPFGG